MSNGVRAIEEAVQDDLRQEHKPLTLFMLGGVDVGKTYVVTALANRFFEYGLTVAVVDADVGQSDIGPPCCVGMGVLTSAITQLSEVPLHSLYFVGNTSPNGFMRECMNGAVAAVEKAKQLDAAVILVDSTGWVECEDARRFKLLELEAIHPSLVVAIENEHELEHILKHLDLSVIRLSKSREARERTRDERRALREAAYDSYFQAAQDRAFDLSILTEPAEEGILVGLVGGGCDDCYTGDEILGLGVLRELDYEREKVVVLTPVDTETGMKDAAIIKRVKPGVVKLTEVNGHLEEFR